MAKRAKAKPRAKTKIEAPAEATHRPFAKLGASKKAKEPARTPPQKPPPPRVAPPKTEGRHDDAATFAIYMAGVTALEDAPSRIPRTASRIEKSALEQPAADLDEPAREALRTLVTEGVRFEVTDDGERIEGRRVDLDPRELRRLRRGAFAIDAKLDLHGLGLEDAKRAVEAFVKKRAAEGDRCVVVVHGKGTHSPRGIGVLRGEIGAWLSSGAAARHVSAFATASIEGGGDGAVWVLLARSAR